MRGSIVGLELVSVSYIFLSTSSLIYGFLQSDSLNDLARKYYLTLEAIALQTRHIVDEMNAKGHTITSIYMSGGQAKNIPMMQLFANACSMPVVLPANSGLAVVLGSAMLGRFADEATKHTYTGDAIGENLWKCMVEMTPVGTSVAPNASPKEKKLLEAKYKIFRESIDIQKRWRSEMDAASK